MKLHGEKLYSSQFKISIPLTTEKKQAVQVFAIAGENTFIQSKNECLMKVRLAEENGDKIPGVEVLVEAVREFQIRTALLLAACIISIKNI